MSDNVSPAKPDLGVYLEETEFCDYHHPLLQDIVQRITADCTTDREKAVEIFLYTRDNVKYALLGSGADAAASETAENGYGDCGTKTNVHVALLRAAGIPARVQGIMADVAVLQGLIPDWLYSLSMRFYKEDFHFWPECYLDGSWIACEGLLDRALYEGALRKGLFTREHIPTIEWDGETDLVLLAGWKTKDLGHKPSWDDWYVEFKKKVATPKFVDRIMEWSLTPSCRRQTDRVRGQ
jgi:hypothetical protein